MNLLNRRHVQFKVMERSKALLIPMPGEKALLWLDKDAPSAEQTAKSLAFVRAGRAADCPHLLGAGGSEARRDPSLDYKCIMLGRGKSQCRMKVFRIRTRWRWTPNCW